MNATWFHEQGVGVFPLKDRSKEPACKWLAYVATPQRVATFTNYGVRLGTVHRGAEFDVLGVIDTDNADSERWVEQHLPDTPFKVRTARGMHRYYRVHSTTEKFLRRDGLTIEFRQEGQYVVGPGSVHPSGDVYRADRWSERWEDISVFPTVFVFNDGSTGRTASVPGGPVTDDFEFPDEVFAGERHDMLFRQLRSFKALDVAPQDAYDFLLLANDLHCKPPLPRTTLDPRWFKRAWNNVDRPIGRILKPLINAITSDKDGV